VAAILGFIGLVSVIYAAYLGGEMVFTKGTGVNHTAWEAASDDYEAVMSLTSLEENKLYRVTVASVPVVVLRQGLQISAISATCPHAGGPLDEGALDGDVVECPWHGSRFCMQDGRVLTGPATVNAPRYEVRVRNGQVELKRRADH
jgi:nitrite reductase/ring-hydroxylating ferredoxin subunit